MKRFSTRYALLAIIVVLAFLLRLYKINNPILDWHSFRQADTASVTREYIKHGIDLLHPRYLDLGNIQSGKDNLEGYRMVEFPIINAVTALIVKSVPFFSLEVTSRMVAVLFSLATIVCLFYVTKEISGVKVAYLAALVFATLPYSVYYSRAILPESPLVFFFVFSLLGFVFWLKNKSVYWYLGSLLSLALALLMKPFIVFFLPVYAAILFAKHKWKLIKSWLIYPYFILSLVPLIWWRNWVAQYPSGIPANNWLFNSGAHQPTGNFLYDSLMNWFGYSPDGLRYRPAWVRWLFYERLTVLFLGYANVIFLPFAVLKLKQKELLVYGSWWLSSLLYLVVIARGNVQHDYYQYLLLPIMSMTVARGMVLAEQQLNRWLSPLLSVIVVSLIFITGLFLSLLNVKGYYAINNPEYVVAGRAVDQLLPQDAKVIAPNFGDTKFLFQTNRTGWPIGFEIEKKIANGATHYVTTSYDDEARELEKKYFTVQKTTDYIILDLTKPSNEEQ